MFKVVHHQRFFHKMRLSWLLEGSGPGPPESKDAALSSFRFFLLKRTNNLFLVLTYFVFVNFSFLFLFCIFAFCSFCLSTASHLNFGICFKLPPKKLGRWFLPKQSELDICLWSKDICEKWVRYMFVVKRYIWKVS